MSEEVEYSRAFSTDRRLKIVELLSIQSLTVNELAERLSLKPITVRHHIRALEGVGAVKGVLKASKGRGRPAKEYRVTEKLISLEFPKRQYHYLADVLLQTFIQALGEERVTQMLNDMGHEMGKKIVGGLEEQHHVEKWDLELFKNYVVDGFLKQMGTQPELIKVKEDEIRLRIHNCVFLEVVKKYPDVMCAADEKIWDGIMESMGMKMRSKMVKCMGHRDPYCEYLMRREKEP
ncbi:MAG: helix-turn-helix transcriptional regulator [Candidatus Geothermarchaeales archaeon]